VVVVGGAVDVVVAWPVGAVVLVGVEVDVVVVDVSWDGVVVEVVVVVGDGSFGLFPKNVVPEFVPPKMSDSGLPEISSTAVMNSSASTKTMAAAAARAFHE